jgi:hypothetical protein
MIHLGMKYQIVGGIDHWNLLKIRTHLYGRPKEMPKVPEGCEVVGGIDRGAGEELVICETLSEMEALHHEFATGNTVHPITWYQKPAPAK